VLLLHGFPEFWWAWRAQLPELAEAGFRAVAIDLRGYGATDRPPKGYEPYTLTNDLAGVIRALGRPRAHVVGHGWGAWIGWSAGVLQPSCVQSLTVLSMPHPRRLRSALTRSARQIKVAGPLVGLAMPYVPERQLVENDAALVGDVLRRWAAPGWPPAAVEQTYRRVLARPGVAGSALEYHRWVLRSLVRPDGLRYAQRMAAPLTAPVLQIHGALDGSMAPATAQGADRYLAGPHHWRLLPGVGHFPHEEAAPQVSTELLGFLSPLA
jgi:pimeloyl-ACP methyl ester carboxylesterase